jgi:hypothetical protein
MKTETTRWLCVPAGPHAVNLVPTGEHAAGPDVFCKAAELDALREQVNALQALVDRARLHVADASCGAEPTLPAVMAAVALLADINKALAPNARGKPRR